MTDRVVSKILVRDNRLKRGINSLEISSEELRLNLSELVELDKGVLKHSLVLFGERLGDNTGHEGQELDEILGVFALSY